MGVAHVEGNESRWCTRCPNSGESVGERRRQRKNEVGSVGDRMKVELESVRRAEKGIPVEAPKRGRLDGKTV